MLEEEGEGRDRVWLTFWESLCLKQESQLETIAVVQEGMMVSGTGSGDGGESVQIKERVQWWAVRGLDWLKRDNIYIFRNFLSC